MSLLFPRFAYAPVRCTPIRHEVAPLWSLLDDSLNELQRASRQTRRQWNPRFDLKETKEAYSLEGELPGIDQKDLSIEFVDEHTLTIKGRVERHTESGKRPEAVETQQPAAVEDRPATPASVSSTKSHQPTVEDDVEEPANSSAVSEKAEVSKPATPEPTKTAQPEQPKQQYWISERSVGEFSRSFSFPKRIDQEVVKASLKNGILSIVVPKAATPESRRINIE